MNNLKRYLPPIMRTPFWSSFMDTVEEVILDLKEQKIDNIKDTYSISDSSKEDLIELAHMIFGLDTYMLENLLDFLVDVQLNKIEDSSLTESEKQFLAYSVALERFRQEILKIPYSMAKRGTLSFYISTLEFFDFNYPGILSSIKTESDNRISRIQVNLSLEPCEDNQTSHVLTPKVLDSVSNIEGKGYYYLDQMIEGKYGVMDAENVHIYLDQEENVVTKTYRKTMFLGLLINSNTSQYYSTGEIVSDKGSYAGSPTFPESLGRYYQSFIDLNKRATEVILFGPMLSLNLVQPKEGTTISNQIFRDQRMAILWDPSQSLPSNFTGFRFKFYSENLKDNSSAKPFYEQNIYDYTLTENSLVVFGMLQGENLKHYRRVTEIRENGEEYLQVDIPKEDWKDDFILRLYSSFNESLQYLFYRDKWNNLIQRVNNSGLTDLRAEVDTSSDAKNVIITFRAINGELGDNLNTCTYMSQLLHSHVNTIQLVHYKEDKGIETEGEILRIEFLRNTQIEVCKGIIFSTYLCCHFNK